MTTTSKIKVIFFDVGNTLLFPNRERIHAPLVERGFRPDNEHLRDLDTRLRFRLFEAGKNDSVDAIIEEIECRSPRRRVSLETLLEIARKP